MTSFTGRSGVTRAFSYAGPSNTERTTSGTASILNGLLGITRTTSGTNITSFVRDPQGALISMTNSAGTFYYTIDALGSTITLTDSNQTKAANYNYDSWGYLHNMGSSTGTQAANNPFQYTGGYVDPATWLVKLGARYYEPEMGRFTQPDPSGQEANTYLYAAANPINNTDPSGLVYLNVSAEVCLIVCAGVTIGIDPSGVYVGEVVGAGTRIEVGASGGVGAGSLGGTARAVECSNLAGSGYYYGIGVAPPDAYGGGGFGYGGGCSIMSTTYKPLF